MWFGVFPRTAREKTRWVSNDYSSYRSVTDMLSNLRWQSLENRCTNMCLAMFYNIAYGLVAIPLLSYFEHSEVYTLATCTLFRTDRFTHQSFTTKTCFSPYPLFFETSYQLILSWFLNLTPLKQESARSINIIHTLKCILFLICLLTPNTIIFFSSHYHSFIFTSVF